MSDDDTQPAETAESAETVAAPQLGIADLKLMANILEVVSARGAIKANEMAAVGTLYNNLMTFLVANGVVPVEQTGEDTAETAETDQAQGVVDA